MRILLQRLFVTVVTLAAVVLPLPSAAEAVSSPVGWNTDSLNTRFDMHPAGQTGTDPYEGALYTSIRATQPLGSLYQDINRTIGPGDTFCASAQVVTEGSAVGGSVDFALFLQGGTTEKSNRPITDLPNGNNWTSIGACITATSTHTSLRVQFYAPVNGPWIGIDAVNVYTTLNTNAGFNNGVGTWTTRAGTTLAVPGHGDPVGEPYEGAGYAAATAPGSFYQLISQSVNPGDTFCASGLFTSYASGGGSGGSLAIWLTGGSTENTSRPFANLPGMNTWVKQRTCVTATAGHTQIVLEVYPQANVPTLAVDMLEVHKSLAVNGGFNNGASAWSVFAPTVYTTYGSGITSNDPYEGSRFAAVSPGGSLYKDIPATTSPSVCLSAQATSLGSVSGAGVKAGVWDMSLPSPPLIGYKEVGNLPANNTWVPFTTCAWSYSGAGTRRLEFYVLSRDIALDSVDATSSLTVNSGMNIVRIG